MQFHHRHLPTFVRAWHAVRAWYETASIGERFIVEFILGVLLVYLLYLWIAAPPGGFPLGAYVTVGEGEPLSSIAGDFKERGLISSATLFTAVSRLVGSDRHIPAGVYYFPHPQNLVLIAIRITSGDFEITPVRITVVEGDTVKDIASLLLQKMPTFDRRTFLNRTKGKEGYLFPDTYFFMPGDSVDAILSVFNNGFHSHIAKIQPQIDAFDKPLPEVLTMASMIEKEAADTQSRRTIAGILWHRLALGMPLQVDAVFPYILDKSALNLSSDDLKIDSPYNTYIHKGLPPGPIDNPGLDAITATVTPIKTKYLYYLSDKNGNFHYAATYVQHLANKKKYLGG